MAISDKGIAYYGMDTLFAMPLKGENHQRKAIHLMDGVENIELTKAVYKDGLVWLSLKVKGLWAYDVEKEQVVKKYNAEHFKEITTSEIYSFFFKGDKIFAFSRDGNMYIIDPLTDEVTVNFYNSADPSSLPTFGAGASRFINDSRGTSWLPSEQNGVIYFDETKAKFNCITTLPDGDSFYGKGIRGICANKDFIVWEIKIQCIFFLRIKNILTRVYR